MPDNIVSFYYSISKDGGSDFRRNARLVGALNRLNDMFRIQVGPPQEEGTHRVITLRNRGQLEEEEFTQVATSLLRGAGLPDKVRLHTEEAKAPIEEAVHLAGGRLAGWLGNLIASIGQEDFLPEDRYIISQEADRYADRVLAMGGIYPHQQM
jgi:hypothetical protein